MKNLFLLNLVIGMFLASNSFAQLQNFEDELSYVRNIPLASSPTEIMESIKNLNDWYVNYWQEALANLNGKERVNRGRDIAETVGLEVVRTRNTLIFNGHVLRLKQKIEQIEAALENDNYPRLWMRQSDELILDRSRKRLAIIEQILDFTGIRESGILDVAITDLSAFLDKYRGSQSNRTLIQTFSDSNSTRIMAKPTTMSSYNPYNLYSSSISSDQIARDPELAERWMDYLDARGLREEIERLRRLFPSTRESRKRHSEIISDFLNLQEDRQTLQTLREEASLLEDALVTMYGVVSISFDQFVRENTPLIANLFELGGYHSRLADIRRLMESSENAKLKQKLQSLHTEFIKMTSLIPNVPENMRSLTSSCRNTSKLANKEISSNAIAFLEALNISFANSIASANDLSFMFLEPTLQGGSLSCVAHSVASDMEFEINKTTHRQVDIDEEYTYLKLQGSDYNWRNPISAEVKDKLSQGNWNDHGYPDRSVRRRGFDFLDSFEGWDPFPLPFEHYNATAGVLADIEPGDHQRERQEVIDRLRSKPRYTVGAYVRYAGPVGCFFIRLLIDNNQPPLVTLASNARKLSGEDWLHIPPMGTGILHTALIVGYGEGIDPRDMVKKPYFILRDSFVDEPIHYKVAADELLPQIRNISKITEVVHLNPIPSLAH